MTLKLRIMNITSFKQLMVVIREDFAINSRVSGSVLLSHRIGRFAYSGDRSAISRFLFVWAYRILRFVFQQLLAGCDIPAQCRLGRRLTLHHNALGIVINGDATVGDDVILYHQVTIGVVRDGDRPTIGDGVFIGVGAKVLGSVTVGDGARVGAQALVLTDVPPNATAVGVPARVMAMATKAMEKGAR